MPLLAASYWELPPNREGELPMAHSVSDSACWPGFPWCVRTNPDSPG
jgi:hypothetical protein